MTTEEIIKFLTDQKEYTAVIKVQDEIIRKLNNGDMLPRVQWRVSGDSVFKGTTLIFPTSTGQFTCSAGISRW